MNGNNEYQIIGKLVVCICGYTMRETGTARYSCPLQIEYRCCKCGNKAWIEEANEFGKLE